jgi:predicted nucleic acid-binding protein
VNSFFEALSDNRLGAVTSTITLLEVLVQPYRSGNSDLVQKYRDILLFSENLFTLPVSSEIADKAAELRSRYGIRTPDAIQISTAIQGGASAFLTNDKDLGKIQEIKVVTLSELI